MNDPEHLNEEELMQCWQTSTFGAPDPRRLSETMSSHVTQFDRKIFVRNAAEYVGGTVLLIWAGYKAFHGQTSGLIMCIGVLFMMGYLWWSHRDREVPDPLADARSYQRAMLRRVDKQIRLLRRVWYWYLLPLYVPVWWMASERWQSSPAAAVIAVLIVTAAFGFVGWLNVKFGVSRLKAARQTWAAMFEDPS
jgi:hypothetical protein